MTEKVDFLNVDIPWPRAGDKLIEARDGPDAMLNACVNYLYDHGEGYTSGYKDAGDALFRHVEATHCDRDTLVYPMLFMYRHYVELRLKRIITVARHFVEEPSKNLPTGHKIELLWSQARPLIERCNPKGEASELDAVEAIIREFGELDPNGVAFRYNRTTEGAVALDPNVTHINLRQVYEVVGRVANFLDSVEGWIGVELDQKREWEREMRSEYESEMRSIVGDWY